MDSESTFFEASKKKILDLNEKFTMTDEKSYLFTYDHFIRFFKEKEPLTEHDVIIGISFVYSWMPRILTIKTAGNGEVLKAVNNAREERRLNEKEMEILQKCFNNSLVGTSKFLHFVNLENYAIWDSNVNRFLKGDEPNQGEAMKKVENYVEYLEICDQLIKDDDVRGLIEEVKSQVKKLQKDSITGGIREGTNISDLRALELIFFTAGKEAKENKKQASPA